MRILIDTNVLLDFLTKRPDFFKDACDVIAFCVNDKIEGFIAAHSVVNAFYLMRKDYLHSERRKIILNVLKCLSIVDIDEEKIISSLENEEFTDFEDCLQDECAEEIRADYIVTRDMNDFTKSKIPAITPSDFVKLMK
ncbi:MAG: PIN domain-containing protein [Spirochaetales bacterium]|nr:PIN domain-containing protein [Spirochaetales bacterium]